MERNKIFNHQPLEVMEGIEQITGEDGFRYHKTSEGNHIKPIWSGLVLDDAVEREIKVTEVLFSGGKYIFSNGE